MPVSGSLHVSRLGGKEGVGYPARGVFYLSRTGLRQRYGALWGFFERL